MFEESVWLESFEVFVILYLVEDCVASLCDEETRKQRRDWNEIRPFK